MASKLPKLTLLNGLEFPLFGYGTGGLTDAEVLKKSLPAVLDEGIRHIDTAQFYLNEHIIGEFLDEAIKSRKIQRKDIWITTKLPPFYHQPEYVEKAIKESLERLRTDYIDMFLVHSPTPVKPIPGLDPSLYREKFMKNELKIDTTPHIETWRVLEKFYKQGTLKAIGISNFNKKQIQDIWDQAEIKPMNLQVECHALLQQHDLHDFCKKLGIVMTSYSTLGHPGLPAFYRKEGDPEPLKVDLIHELAEKYGKTAPQILLRYMVQRGIAVIPKSTKPERIHSNHQIFDFELAQEDMAKINEIKEKHRIFDLIMLKHHPYYPFHED